MNFCTPLGKLSGEYLSGEKVSAEKVSGENGFAI